MELRGGGVGGWGYECLRLEFGISRVSLYGLRRHRERGGGGEGRVCAWHGLAVEVVVVVVIMVVVVAGQAGAAR